MWIQLHSWSARRDTFNEELEALQATGNREVSTFGGVNLDERQVEFFFVEKQRRDAAAA
jgi:hypothetical protein